MILIPKFFCERRLASAQPFRGVRWAGESIAAKMHSRTHGIVSRIVCCVENVLFLPRVPHNLTQLAHPLPSAPLLLHTHSCIHHSPPSRKYEGRPEGNSLLFKVQLRISPLCYTRISRISQLSHYIIREGLCIPPHQILKGNEEEHDNFIMLHSVSIFVCLSVRLVSQI